MYVDLLSRSFVGWDAELAGDALIDYVRDRRTRASESGPNRGDVFGTLAAEIEYDRALMTLCHRFGIDVVPEQFAFPRTERAHLEQLVRAAGIDLNHLAQTVAR